MRIVYFGSGAFGLPTLEALARRHEVVAVVTQPDRPAGRGGTLTPTPIAEWAARRLPGVPLLKPFSVNEPDPAGLLRAFDADAWVVIAFGQKLGRSLLERVTAINLHASLLPRWRGAAPISAAILAGDEVSGNSVITLADRMDAGLILGQATRPIGPALTAGELHDQLASDGPALVLDVLDAHAAGRLTPRAQEESLATKAPKLSRADDWLDLSLDASINARRINALSPWPGITVRIAAIPLKLLRAKAVQGDAHQTAVPGTITDAARGLFACAAGSLELLDLQPAGGRAMSWSDFAHGRRIPTGAVLLPNPRPAPC